MHSRREHLPNFIAGCRPPLVRTALSKVKRLRGPLRPLKLIHYPNVSRVDSECFRELTDGARFDMLAR
jgi:hypothetical protein